MTAKLVLGVGVALAMAGVVATPAQAREHSAGNTSKGLVAHPRGLSLGDYRPPGWSAGGVARGTGYWRPGGSDRVREVQRRLNRRGYASGPVDGLLGPITEGAIRRFQARRGLRVDGIVGPYTLSRLRGEQLPRSRTGRRTRADRETQIERQTQAAEPPTRADRQAQARPDTTPGTREVPVAGKEARPAATPAGTRRFSPDPDTLVGLLIALGVLGVAVFARSYLRALARGRAQARAGEPDPPVAPRNGAVAPPAASAPIDQVNGKHPAPIPNGNGRAMEAQR